MYICYFEMSLLYLEVAVSHTTMLHCHVSKVA